MKALSELSCWLCSFLDKWLLTFKSQKGSLSLNEAFQKVMEKKKRWAFSKHLKGGWRLLPADIQDEMGSEAPNRCRLQNAHINACAFVRTANRHRSSLSHPERYSLPPQLPALVKTSCCHINNKYNLMFVCNFFFPFNCFSACVLHTLFKPSKRPVFKSVCMQSSGKIRPNLFSSASFLSPSNNLCSWASQLIRACALRMASPCYTKFDTRQLIIKK